MTDTRQVVPPGELVVFQAEPVDKGLRLDAFLAKKCAGYSRSFFKKLVSDGRVRINDVVITKSGKLMQDGEEVRVAFPEQPEPVSVATIEKELGVEVIFEHTDFLVVYKPPGLVVHVPHERYEGPALVDWLVHHFKDVGVVGLTDRPGIVHRIDMDTSGIMLVARNNYAHKVLSDLFRDRAIKKTYLALVRGNPPAEGTIEKPITRHPKYRKRMTHVSERQRRESWALTARESVTHYTVLEYFTEAALVEVRPVTGRTHQIRVHFASIGHPLLGDVLYGKQSALLQRQALHAHGLDFTYEGRLFSFRKELPEDMQRVIEQLRKP